MSLVTRRSMGSIMLVRSHWQLANTGLLFAFAALLIMVPSAYAVLSLAGVGIALVGWFMPPRWAHIAHVLDVEDVMWCTVLMAFGVVWLFDVWRTGIWPAGEGLGLPLWPCLAVLLLAWLRCWPPVSVGWWLGVGCGALGAGVIALIERGLYNEARANSGINSIPFGNLSLLLGILSLVVALWLAERRGLDNSRNAAWLFLALLAASGGIIASLLSGTRGGWIAIPLLLWPIILTYRGVLFQRRFLVVGTMLAIALSVIVLHPQSGVTQRVAQGATELQRYWSEGVTRGSVGVRLEMWRGGVLLFAQKPLLGWGEGRVAEARDELVEAGILTSNASEHDQLHNDFIDTAARRGLLGLFTLAMLYAVPLWLFWRRLSHPDMDVRALAVAGVLIPIAFIDFGLTQSMLRDVRGLAGYLGFSIGIWSVLKAKCAYLPDRA